MTIYANDQKEFNEIIIITLKFPTKQMTNNYADNKLFIRKIQSLSTKKTIIKIKIPNNNE